MPAENARKGTPPYISPTTFRHLLEQLQKNPTDRIDRSYLDELHSGSTSAQIMSALRYLNLVDSINKPTHHLKLLVGCPEEEKPKRLRDIAGVAYGFVLNNGVIDTQTATYQQLEEMFFDHSGVDGDVRRKCIKFFTSMAQDAGIPLSPHITKKMRMARSSGSSRAATKKTSSRSSRTLEIPQPAVKIPEHTELLEKLLDKFPDFDPGWTDEQKMKWLEGFSLFMMRIYPPEPKKQG
jgi:hypothetical protein